MFRLTSPAFHPTHITVEELMSDGCFGLASSEMNFSVGNSAVEGDGVCN
jgi:hypothetical protein